MTEKTKTVYVAQDGKQFDLYHECLEYDEELDNTVYVATYENCRDGEYQVLGVYRNKEEAEKAPNSTNVIPFVLT